MLKKIYFFTIMFLFCISSNADDAIILQQDSVSVSTLSKPRQWLEKVYGIVKEFSRIDTAYVEPQAYNYTVMLLNSNAYEIYRLEEEGGQSITFAPKPSVKVGPYFGWRWLVLGYTIDFTHLSDDKHRQDFNVSMYSNQIGVDLFYRKSGDDFRIRSAHLGNEELNNRLHNQSFEGIHSTIKGFNLYYIFNHKRFSYPAAYSQSTVQKISCGSWLAGIGYTQHLLGVDWNALDQIISLLNMPASESSQISDGLRYEHIAYTDISVSCGYTYNWVFAPNFLFNASLSTALAHKHSKGDIENNSFLIRGFSFRNFNLDGVGRFGLVYNNKKWYAGASAIFHTYNYNKSQFHTRNTFGNVNFYVGFNFMKKR